MHKTSSVISALIWRFFSGENCKYILSHAIPDGPECQHVRRQYFIMHLNLTHSES